jgi:hypothetical protein
VSKPIKNSLISEKDKIGVNQQEMLNDFNIQIKQEIERV